jgi:hypothetical protein
LKLGYSGDIKTREEGRKKLKTDGGFPFIVSLSKHNFPLCRESLPGICFKDLVIL